MRKSIVYYWNDKALSLGKDLRSTPPKTRLYAHIKLAIAFNNLKICVFDPSGALSARYYCDRLNDSMKDE